MGATPTPRPYWTPDAPVVRLSEPERTSIAEQIRTLVEGFSLTYTWLIRQLSDEGLMTDKFEMSATLAGVRTGSKADEILRRSLSILQEYEERMGGRASHECVCAGSASPGQSRKPVAGSKSPRVFHR